MEQVKAWISSNKLLAVLIILAAVAVFSAVWNWYHPKVQTITKTEYQTVQQEKVVTKIKRVTVPGPTQIVTIEKEAIAKELDMPWLLDGGNSPVPGNPQDLQVVSNADVPRSNSGYSAVAVTNTNSGETKIVVKEKPAPLFGLPSDIEAGVRYGLSTSRLQEGNAFARWQFLRIGKVYVGAYSEISTQPQAKVMVEAAFRF